MLRDASKRNKVILGLRILAIVLALTGAAGLGWATTKEDMLSTDGLGKSFDFLGLICLSISGFWCLIAFLVTVIFNDPIPLGVFIGFDVALFVTTLAIGISVATAPINEVYSSSCSATFESSESFMEDYCPDKTAIWRIVGAVFCLANSFFHLAVVVYASKDCHQRRKAQRKTDHDIELKG